MAYEIPQSSEFSGLTAKVIAWSEAFTTLTETGKRRELTEADWSELDAMVDADSFERMGPYFGEQTEWIDWPTYKSYMTKYASNADWEGTLRRVTETEDLVFLELEERITRDGEIKVVNTVLIYHFAAAGKIDQIDVYIAPIETRPA